MTISSTTDRVSFEGNGVATSFPLPFRFFSNSDIQVSLIDEETGLVTQLSIGIDYTLIGAGAPEQDGSTESVANMVVAPPIGKTLFVQRVMEIVQPTDIVNQGRFFPEVHETVFDRLTMLVQQAALGPSRTIRVPEFDPIPERLPSVAARATKVFGFDENGDPVVSSLSLSAIEQQPLLAQGYAEAAALSALAASDSAASSQLSNEGAAASALRAQEWAENPEDAPVLPGKFSALHWAAKAMQSLAGLVARVLALENIGKPFTKEYVSAEQAITNGGVTSLTHLLGTMPKLVSVTAICKVAQHGYAVGDEVSVKQDNADFNYGLITGANSLNIRLIVAISGITVLTDAGVGQLITNANWRLIVRAWA